MTGSLNQRRYLAERAAGKPIKEACFWSGIPEDEAPFIEDAVERGDLVLPTNEPPEIITQNIPEPPPIGHNSKESTMADGNVAAEQLRLFIERIERLAEEKKGIADDIKDVFAEAKGQGYSPSIMREIIKERAMDKDARDEREALLDTYRHALGLLADLPLGQAAMARAA